nr:FSD1-like protein isoform X3 [Ciona intestinalis]XP_026694148.1 FSD1-like protein isoform X2 [Ciona intestinalis]XP_026694149.1 FSD1-like protein isoform X2 [Ciona intestinalis]|eukprot:XP_018670990.1 FSD1-like protein isoform X3 [Ciona intestinalis]
MDKQKEALGRIVDSLRTKYVEATAFESDLQSDLRLLSEAFHSSLDDLNSEFEKLESALELRKKEMLASVEEEMNMKTSLIKNQLKNYQDSRTDADELILISKEAMDITNNTQFNQVALSIKERVTMSPIFRLSSVASVTDISCHLVADFTREQTILNKLTFLPVPQTPIILEELCTASDNTITCQWNLPTPDTEENSAVENEDIILPSTIESYVFQFRQVKADQGNQDVPWKTEENIKTMEYVIKGLVFDKPFIQIRVQSWNKAVGGEFSRVATIATPAYSFNLDADACHGNLKVTTPITVEWDPTAMKAPEGRARSAGKTQTSNKTSSPKKTKKDRFIGESYTVLGDSPISDDEIYYEVTAAPDSKTYSVGLTSRSISRYDQIGRTPNSWCIFVSSWIQNTFVAKHNNKMKNLEATKVPARIGVYYNSQLNFLSFYDVDTRSCIHSFKQVKALTQMVPGFSVWCGSIQIHTGIQVPSWVLKQPASPQTKSIVASSVASSEQVETT